MNKVYSYACLSCGSGLSFKPDIQKWKCDYCKTEFDSEELERSNKGNSDLSHDTDTNIDSYECDVCGAVILTDANTSATFCIYCKNPAIIKTRFSGQFKPDKLIPFKLTREQAMSIYKAWIKKRIFAPKDFKTEETFLEIRGVYTPYWLFDCHVTGAMSAQATKVRTWTMLDRRYTETKFYALEREGSADYNGVPADGSKKLDDSLSRILEPYNYKDLIDFRLQYMSGFMAEKYDVSSYETKPSMEVRVKEYFTGALKNSMSGYNSVSVKNARADITGDKISYAMLPVYIIVNKFKGTPYTFLINGQTGKVAGDAPNDFRIQAVYFIVIFLFSLILSVFGGALFV